MSEHEYSDTFPKESNPTSPDRPVAKNLKEMVSKAKEDAKISDNSSSSESRSSDDSGSSSSSEQTSKVSTVVKSKVSHQPAPSCP